VKTFTGTVDGASVSWRDRRRYLWPLGLVVPLLPFAAAQWAESAGWTRILWFAGPLWVLLVIPLLDAILGEDRSNPPDWVMAQLGEDRYYRWCTYAFLPLQYGGLVLACWVVADRDLAWFEMLGYALTVGTVGGLGINTAHELGHKTVRGERLLARLALAQTGYGHFHVEHNRGHHDRVATPEDPASARLGETLWAFLPRVVVGSAQSAWRLEAKRLRARHKRVLSLHNDVLGAWALTFALFGALVAAFGWTMLPFLVLQAVFGFSLLEVVNYVEHYGLLRQRDAAGRLERCSIQHSWNSSHVASNLILYQLERHSDHHAHPTRRYPLLRHFEESPQLPSGYGLMVVLACVPPLWRAVMDRRVLAHYRGNLELANIHPPARERLVARYGPGR